MVVNYKTGKFIGSLSVKDANKISTTFIKDKSANYIRGNASDIYQCYNYCTDNKADYMLLNYNNNRYGCMYYKFKSANKKKEFEKQITDKNKDMSFEGPEWVKNARSPNLLKYTNYKHWMYFDLKTPPYKSIGYYNIDTVEQGNVISGFYYVVGQGVNKIDGEKVMSSGLTQHQTWSNTSIMYAFLTARQNECELVMLHRSPGKTPVVYMGKLDSIMKDCHVDIVRGELNPFFSHLTDKKPKSGDDYYEVYLRPDLDKKKIIQANKECNRKKSEQHKQLQESNLNIKQFNANHYGSTTGSVKKNIINSMYSGLDKIEAFTSNNSTEYFTLSERKSNIDAYFDMKQKEKSCKTAKLQSQYQKELDNLKKSTNDRQDHINVLKELSKKKEETVADNYKTIQGVNQKLYKLNSKIESTSTKFEYNKNMVKMLRIFLLCLFIFMLCMIAYYGTRDTYGAKIRNKLQSSVNTIKSKFDHSE